MKEIHLLYLSSFNQHLNGLFASNRNRTSSCDTNKLIFPDQSFGWSSFSYSANSIARTMHKKKKNTLRISYLIGYSQR